MGLSRISADQLGALQCTRTSAGRALPHRHALSRREFVRTIAGSVALGAAVGTGLARPRFASAAGSGTPVPLPGGSPVLQGLFGELFHVYAPGFDPVDAAPITITDFNGLVGLAYVSGTVQRTNMVTNTVETLPFVDSDMRFMKGIYRGADGKMHDGAFGFI